MKTVEPLTLRSLVVPALVLLCGCSGAPTDPGASGGPGAEPDSVVALDDVTNAQQDPQDITQQRRQAMIEDTLARARRSVELKLWDDVRAAAADVLELDPTNEEARSMLHAASTMLGDPTGQALDFTTRAQVAYERDRFRARQELQVGDSLASDERYGDAIERYERAQLIMEYNPFAAPNDALRQEIETKLQMAQQRQAQAMNDAVATRRAASAQALEDQERRARIARNERLERLLTQANMDFQLGRYREAVDTLDQALAVDPNDGNALALRDLAGRAKHEATVDVLRQRWKAEWSQTFDDLRSGNVPQTDVLRIDPARWAEVDKRKPISFTPPEALDSRERRALRQDQPPDRGFDPREGAAGRKASVSTLFARDAERGKGHHPARGAAGGRQEGRRVRRLPREHRRRRSVRQRLRRSESELEDPRAGGSQYFAADARLRIGRDPGPPGREVRCVPPQGAERASGMHVVALLADGQHAVPGRRLRSLLRLRTREVRIPHQPVHHGSEAPAGRARPKPG